MFLVCKNTFVSSFCTQLSGVYKKYCNELLFNFHTLYRHSRQCHYYNVNVQLCASICLVNIKLAKKWQILNNFWWFIAAPHRVIVPGHEYSTVCKQMLQETQNQQVCLYWKMSWKKERNASEQQEHGTLCHDHHYYLVVLIFLVTAVLTI